MSRVFLLWHTSHAIRPDGSVTHGIDAITDEQAGDEVSLLGVYSSAENAAERITRARTLPGFSDEPDCFEVASYTVDKDAWTAGFERVDVEKEAR